MSRRKSRLKGEFALAGMCAPTGIRELSSYFRFILAPELGIDDGKLRVLSADQIAIAGSTDILGQRRFLAKFRVNPEAAEPLQLESAAVQVVDAGASRFGWVAVPTPVLIRDRWLSACDANS